ncbi:hypothetical protein D9M68_548350 [compost metagenome]
MFQLEGGRTQVLVRLGVLGQQAAAKGQRDAQGEELQVAYGFAAEIGQVVAPAVLVARAETLDMAVTQVQPVDAVIQVEAQGGRRQDACGVVVVLGVAADLLAAAQHQFPGVAGQAAAQVGLDWFGQAVGRLHRIVRLQVADAGGPVADAQVIGQAVAVVQAEQVVVPAGVEAELGALDPFVAGRAYAVAVVFLPVELAVTQRTRAVLDKAFGPRTSDQQAPGHPRQVPGLNSAHLITFILVF